METLLLDAPNAIASDRDAFQNAINANPKDLGLRLVFGDWLLENGHADEARAYLHDAVLVEGAGVAENIRRVLKKAFPGVKFSVRTSRGSSSVRVYWSFGPTTEQVKWVTNRHENGRFDGQSDCYQYDNDPFTDIFGGVNYVFETRNYGENEGDLFWRLQDQGQLQEFMPHQPEWQVKETFWLILSKSPLGKTLNGIRRIEGVKAGLPEDFWEAY